jgi:tetratricopeptide (TPR) repeat protein
MEACVPPQNRYAEAIVRSTSASVGRTATEAGLQYAASKAQLLTAAYNATSDKMYLQNAIGVYESLRLKWPKNSSVLNNLAYLLAQNDERLAEALAFARTAVEQNPDEANYLDTYGYLLYRNGQPAQAAQSLAAAVKKYEVRGKAPMDATSIWAW